MEQPQQTASETSSLEALELKANLNPVQKNYLEKLKAKRDKILQGRTAEQLAKAGDLETLKIYKAVLDEILQFLKTKEMKPLDEEFQAKALDYLEMLLRQSLNDKIDIDREEIDEEYISIGLAGIGTEQAWKMREKLLELGIDESHVVAGLAGLDSEQAWAMREKLLLKKLKGEFGVAQSLTGLDSDRAWQMRERLIEQQGIDKDSIARSLAGLGSDRAWAMREKLLGQGVRKDAIAQGLAGLDSDRAWAMREKLFEQERGFVPSYVVAGLAGLDSDRAWAMREKLLVTGERIFVANSLAGLDSDRAWQMRERLLEQQGTDKDYIAESLAGLDSDRAWAMREKLLEQGATKGDIALGVYGGYLMVGVRKARADREKRNQ